MANKKPTATANTALTARLGKKQKSKPGNLQEVISKVWAALERAEQALETDDMNQALKACHCIFQGAQAYSKVYETGELEARLAVLEVSQGSTKKRGTR